MGRFECLHQGDLFFDALFTDIAVLIGIESAFIMQHTDIAFTHNSLGVLSLPSFGRIQQQIKVKWFQFISIFEVWFELLDEVVPEQETVSVELPGKTDVGKGSQSGKKSAVLPLDLEVDEVSKLQNGVSGTKKTVVGTNVLTGQYQCDGVFVLRFSDTQYEPFDNRPLFYCDYNRFWVKNSQHHL